VFPQRKGPQLLYMSAEERPGGVRSSPIVVGIDEAKNVLREVRADLSVLVRFYATNNKRKIVLKTLEDHGEQVGKLRARLWDVKDQANTELKGEMLYTEISNIEANNFQKIDEYILDAQQYKDDFEKYKLALYSFEAALRKIIDCIDDLLKQAG
jgi:hypothetical protein